MRRRLLGSCVVALLTACGGGGGTNDGGASKLDLAQPSGDLHVSQCGASGPFGTYTVSGGQSGLVACGHQFTAFTGGMLTVAMTSSGGATLTTTGTGEIGDVTNCPATITDECKVTASACATGGGSTISYSFTTFTHQLQGTGSPSIPDESGGCQFTYSVEGTR